jgi:uncharacterized membrane protein YkoI
MKRMTTWFLAASMGLVAAPSWAHEKHEKKHEHTAMKFEELPAPVQSALKQEAQGGDIQEVRKEKEHGKVIYEAEVVNNGKGRDIEVSAEGKILERGKAHDEEKEKAAGHHER